MASRLRKDHAIVLSKTQLKESDLIIKLVNKQGCLIEAVAKGARNPNSTNSARLELLNEVEILAAEGKSLDTVKEVRLISAPIQIHTDPLKSAAAAQLCELTLKTIHKDLEVERLFDLVKAAIDSINTCQEKDCPALVAAFLLKAASIMGVRPSFTSCPICDTKIDFSRVAKLRLSIDAGGITCEDCSATTEAFPVQSAFIQWSEWLIRTKFSEIKDEGIPLEVSLEVLELARIWCEAQLNLKLKSASSLKIYLSEYIS